VKGVEILDLRNACGKKELDQMVGLQAGGRRIDGGQSAHYDLLLVFENGFTKWNGLVVGVIRILYSGESRDK